jgi:DNA-binding NarL/FixJ family response regulator
VAVLTGEQRPEVLADAYRAGATTVLDKGIPFQILVQELRNVIEGRTDSARARREQVMQSARAAAAVRRSALEPFENLTRREQEVLADLMKGLQAVEIADRAYVSLTTIRSQIRSVLLKLGVNSQLAAVAKAIKAGWEPHQQSL